MKKINYTEEICIRCGSKKFISRVWKEKIATYSGGTTEVEYSKIECTNKECQEAFNKQFEEEKNKKEALRIKKEESDAMRQANSSKQIRIARANKSRI